MTTATAHRRPARPRAATLRRLYSTEDRPLAELAARYRVARRTVRQWLVEAGIAIRSRAEGGHRRHLDPPPRRQLNTLAKRGLSLPQIAGHLKVSPSTARRWFHETGLEKPRTSLRNRPRGSAAPVRRPTRSELHQLYVTDGLSIAAMSDRLGVSTHLIRTWVLEDEIGMRPPGGRRGISHPHKPSKPAPPTAELRKLRETQRLSRTALAARYHVHPQTVSRWLHTAGLPSRLPPPGKQLTDDELVAWYRREPLSAAEIARRAGMSPDRVRHALRRAGVALDPGRQAAAVRAAAAARRGTVPSLPDQQAEWAVTHYQADGWSYRQIADALDVSAAKVRGELRRRGVPARRHAIAGPSSRAARHQAPIEDVRRLYIESEWSAEDIAARLDTSGLVVLRTGHAHGVPIRQGGHPAVSATVALIDALYADVEVSQMLDRHDVPRRPPGGDIAVRFPEPVPLTPALLRDLYGVAGCSSGQIELLTGQSQAVVRATMHRHAIPLRAEHMSPALLRLRAAARDQFLAAVVAEYRNCGSTRLVADQHNCAPETVRRWLAAAGVTVPGRGQWSRSRISESPRCTSNRPRSHGASRQ